MSGVWAAHFSSVQFDWFLMITNRCISLRIRCPRMGGLKLACSFTCFRGRVASGLVASQSTRGCEAAVWKPWGGFGVHGSVHTNYLHIAKRLPPTGIARTIRRTVQGFMCRHTAGHSHAHPPAYRRAVKSPVPSQPPAYRRANRRANRRHTAGQCRALPGPRPTPGTSEASPCRRPPLRPS